MLTQNFCHLILEERPTGCGEPLLQTHNSELRAFEKMVQSKIEESPTSTIQISKGEEKKRSLSSRETYLHGSFYFS